MSTTQVREGYGVVVPVDGMVRAVYDELAVSERNFFI